MSGTVNIDRGLFDHDLFKDEPFTEREAWVWMIMEARWRAGRVRVGDYIIDLARGELSASVRFMAAAWDWTAARVQRYLERLKKMKMICVKTDTGVSVITICNYDKFQNGAEAADTGPIQVRYRSDTKEKKDVRREEDSKIKEEAKASSKSRASRLSPEWRLPKAWGEFALAEGMTEHAIRREADRFRDYWLSVPAAKGVKSKWEAVWRNWIRKVIDDMAEKSVTHVSADKPKPGEVREFAEGWKRFTSAQQWELVNV